jgi:arsenate reductase
VLRIDAPRTRKAFAEFVGTGLFVAAVVGSGIAAQRLSPANVGLQLLENALATAGALAAIILAVGPVSGAHLNPVVSVADRVLGGITTRDLLAYVPAQVTGAMTGCVLANLMFDLDAVEWSSTVRSGGGIWLGEAAATVGLLLVIFGVARSGRTSVAPFAVAAYIGSAYWFTSSTSFANPAITVGRMFSDTFAGIAPASVPGFIASQGVGAVVGLGLIGVLYPRIAATRPEVIVPLRTAQEPNGLPASNTR